MTDTGMNGKTVKQFNRKQVYQCIYDQGTCNKTIITQQLQLGLSTVTQNIKLLEEEGLIFRNGFFESTGGRKADALEIVTTARVAVGIALLKEQLHLVVANLYGQPQYTQVVDLPFASQPHYYAQVGNLLQTFLQECQISHQTVLGVAIAVQGVLSQDGQGISYGKILDNFQMKLEDFTPHIPFPCRIEHDAKAAAQLELWRNKEVRQGMVLLLNRNFGGALVVDGQVEQGLRRRSGTVEHLNIHPDGPLCYCGRRGCLESYCSAQTLENTAGVPIPEFFAQKPENPEFQQIWRDYLGYLATAIRNISVIVDGVFVLSGYLAPFLLPEDLEILLENVNRTATFPLSQEDIFLGNHGEFTQALGGSLFYIQEFLADI